MEQLTALDSQFLALEDDATYGHVGSLAVLDPATAPRGRLTLKDLQRVLAERLHLVPPMTRRLASVPLGLDRPYWVRDPHFDLGYHVREVRLGEPGDDAQLAEEVGRLFSRHLDRSRPLWEMYLITGLPRGRVAVLSKVHHAAVDGLSGAEILTALYDLSPDGRDLASPAPVEDPGGIPNGLSLLLRGVGAVPLYPWRTLSRLPRLLPYVDVVPSVLGLPGAASFSRVLSQVRNTLSGSGDGRVVERPSLRAPRTVFSSTISPHRRFVFGSLPLADIKAVKNAFGVTVNDVVVALVAGAVRSWLLEHADLPERPLLAQIPVSVRTEEQRGTFGNRISVMIVPIPTDVADPGARVARAAEQLLAAKCRHRAIPADALQDVANFIPPAVHARASRVVTQLSGQRWLRPVQNLVISNVPGPPIPIYMAGAELVAFYPVSVIVHGTGLNVTVMSYRGDVNVGIVADREQMPELDDLMAGMRRELDTLLGAGGS